MTGRVAAMIEGLREGGHEDLRLNESMRTHTTFRCGALTRGYCVPESLTRLKEIIGKFFALGAVFKEDFDVVGRGSNLLVRDGGYPGVLIDLERCCRDIDIVSESESKVTLHVGAGVANGKLLSVLKDRSCRGFGFSFGIPGSVGGGIRMNAGTPLGWYGSIVTSVTALTLDAQDVSFEVDESDFSYRNFKKGHNLILTGAVMTFKKAAEGDVLQEIEAAKVKRANQPLEYPNVGSVFKNPPGDYAARLVEACGLKGLRMGDAQISEKHSNFIVNLGSAKTSDVLELMKRMQTEVAKRFSVCLEPEVQVIGVEQA